MTEKKPDFTREVARKAHRKAEARRVEKRDIWSWLGMFGLVGWSVAIPALVGVTLGLWLDERFPGRASWTLTLLLVGLVLGCINAWRWVQKEGREEK